MKNNRVCMSLLCTFVCIIANASIIKDGLVYNLDEENKVAAVVSPDLDNYPNQIIVPGQIFYNEVTYNVVSIQDNAFQYCTSVISITLPNTITSIGKNAFYKCSSLKEFVIPNSVTSIGEYAFEDCTGLTSVAISENVSTIDYLFKGCTGLTSFVIPNNIISINSTFVNCTNLSSVTIPESVVSMRGTFEGCTNLTTVVIPDGVTSLYGTFFGCSSLSSITIPNSITKIDVLSFSGCSNLTSIFLPNSVTEVGNWVFEGCSSLISVTFSNVQSIGNDVFYGCNSLNDVLILSENAPKTSSSFNEKDVKNVTLHVKDIAIESFKGIVPWTYFKEIVCDKKETDFNLTYYVDGEVYKTEKHKYEDKITPLGEPTMKGNTFSGWSEIPETMPAKDVTVTGSFSWSEKTIDNVTYQVTDTINNYCSVTGYSNASGEVKIASAVDFDYKYTVTSIANRAFNDKKYITTVEIPATVTIIGERAFANIDKLTDVTIWAEEIPTTDRTAFENSYIEDYVTLHVPYGSVSKYKDEAPWKNFKSVVGIDGTQQTYDVDGATYVITEDGVTITKGADKEGEVIIDAVVTINGKTYNVTVVGEGAFKDCTKMSSVVIPDAIKTIGASAFEGCSHLTSINIGSGITAIAHKAFANIGSAANAPRRVGEVGLTVSSAADVVPTADSDVFENTDLANATLLVNDNLVDSYKATSPWSQFGNIIGFNEASGIDSILSVQQGAATYSIDGRRLDNIQKGLNIIKTIDGRTRKVIVR